MRKVVLSLCMVICVLACASPASAQSALDQRISELSLKISNGLTENQKRTIAVVEFADLRGNVTDFGRFIAEELITHLYETKKFKVIERQLLNKVISEQKLSLTGMIDQTSAQKLGKLLGVDAIASGTVTDLGESFRVNARLIDTSTGEIFAVANTEIAKNLVKTLGYPSPTVPTSGSGTSYQDANAIASKDIGSLRIVLKSVTLIRLKDQKGLNVDGIRCLFEFINLETRRSIVVAMNATSERKQPEGGRNYIYDSSVGTWSDCGLGVGLRSSLVDSNGDLWSYSSVTGVSIIGVGCAIKDHDPSEIISMLDKQERLNGVTLPSNSQYVYGSPSTINPGQSVSVVMTFVLNANEQKQVSKPQSFQISSEIVVGVLTDTKKSYSLQNVIFDRVSLPAGGS